MRKLIFSLGCCHTNYLDLISYIPDRNVYGAKECACIVKHFANVIMAKVFSYKIGIFVSFLALTLPVIIPSIGNGEKSLKAKFFPQTLTVNGVKREYYIYIPPALQQSKEDVPAVIVYHGFESDAHGIRWLIKPDKSAKEFGYILIYPNAIKKSWNAGKGSGTQNTQTDDLSFASALVDVIIARHRIDPQRVYTMGFSNGAQMVSLMMCHLSHKITGAAMVAHTMNISNCQPKTEVPIVLMNGKRDPFVPFNGGGKYQLRSHKDTIAFFREKNHANQPGSLLLEKDTVTCWSYADRQGRNEVVDCTYQDSGHTWPGGVEFKSEIFGKVNRELEANKFIFQFFKQVASKENEKMRPLRPVGKDDNRVEPIHQQVIHGR